MTTETKTNATGIAIGAQTVNAVTEGVMRVGVGAMISMAGLVGLWAMASMISGIAKAGGLIELGRAWMSAITGM